MPRVSKKANFALWTLQTLLALMFLFAGGMKLVLPLAQLQGPIQLPGLFVRFIGVAEVLGALGLVLPGVFGVHRYLTPLAAGGLVLIMVGATVLTAVGIGLVPALFPFVIGLFAATVCVVRGGLRLGHGRSIELAPSGTV